MKEIPSIPAKPLMRIRIPACPQMVNGHPAHYWAPKPWKTPDHAHWLWKIEHGKRRWRERHAAYARNNIPNL